MQISAGDRDRLFSRLRVIGLPTEILIPFLRDIERWIGSSGLEWTISRLKAIKLDLLRKKAGLDPVSSWVRKGSRGNWFGGSVGAVERWGFKGNNFPKMIQVLNIYTNFYSSTVTEQQARKFVSGVLADPVSVPITIQRKIDLAIAMSGISAPRLRDPEPLLAFVPSEKKGPTIWGSTDEASSLVDSVAYLFLDGGKHYNKFHELYDHVLEGLEPEVLWSIPLDLIPKTHIDAHEIVVGRIGIIQEAGFKLRAVANPGRVFQRVLKPLGDAIYHILRTLPWDCTFDQKKADPAISKALQEGRMVFSVDLTGATDYFPLDLQDLVLSALFPEDHVALFRELSRGLWFSGQSIPKEIIDLYDTGSLPSGFLRWSKGQPLGLYPSFASFALAHGLLLLGLLGRPYNGEFYVLGDDVVILDPVLYRDYRAALGLLGCPVSESKTVNSTHLAEFTSRIYLKEREIPIPQLKWRNPSDDSFLDVLRLLGLSGLNLLTPRQRKVASYVAVIPDFMGGLGFNPDGLDLKTRMEPFLSLLNKDYIPVRRLTDYTRHAVMISQKSRLSQYASDGWTGDRIPMRDLSTIRDLDQRSRVIVQDTIGTSLVPWFSILGTNVDLVLHGNVDLPGEGVPSRRTALQRWENILVDLLGVNLGRNP